VETDLQNGLRCRDIYTKLHKALFQHSEIDNGGEGAGIHRLAQTHRQHGFKLILHGVPVPTAWRDLRLLIEEQPPAMEGTCKYIE
jgi:hypothetical protein